LPTCSVVENNVNPRNSHPLSLFKTSKGPTHNAAHRGSEPVTYQTI
jgi:hypothetical protein